MKKIILDASYLPFFVVGLAPRYKGEWMDSSSDQPVDPMWAGWSTYCILMVCVGAFAIGAITGQEAIAHFRNTSLGEKALLAIIVPVVVALYILIGSIVASLLSLPFQILNGLKEGQ